MQRQDLSFIDLLESNIFAELDKRIAEEEYKNTKAAEQAAALQQAQAIQAEQVAQYAQAQAAAWQQTQAALQAQAAWQQAQAAVWQQAQAYTIVQAQTPAQTEDRLTAQAQTALAHAQATTFQQQAHAVMLTPAFLSNGNFSFTSRATGPAFVSAQPLQPSQVKGDSKQAKAFKAKVTSSDEATSSPEETSKSKRRTNKRRATHFTGKDRLRERRLERRNQAAASSAGFFASTSSDSSVAVAASAATATEDSQFRAILANIIQARNTVNESKLTNLLSQRETQYQLEITQQGVQLNFNRIIDMNSATFLNQSQDGGRLLYSILNHYLLEILDKLLAEGLGSDQYQISYCYDYTDNKKFERESVVKFLEPQQSKDPASDYFSNQVSIKNNIITLHFKPGFSLNDAQRQKLTQLFSNMEIPGLKESNNEVIEIQQRGICNAP